MNGIRLTEEEARQRINERCQELNYTFLGFDNEEDRYTNNKVKLRLRCNKCGSEWDTTAYEKFMTGRKGCPGCNTRRKTPEEDMLKQIRGRCEELGYMFLGYVGGKRRGKVDTRIKLKCKKCGETWDSTTISNFLLTDRTSHTCGRKNPASMPSNYRPEEQIKRINKKLSGSTLSFVSFDGEYIGTEKTVLILHCNECGNDIKMNLHHLIYGINGTPKCTKCQFNGKVSNEDALKHIEEKCNLLDYEFLGFVNKENRYDGKDTRLILKCNKCGYIWKTTTYANFINSIIKCRGCTNNWHLERVVETTLKENTINYELQKRFDWLKNKINLTLDFFLPEYNIAIECQGRQHFIPVDKFGGKEGFEDTKVRDAQKKKLCKEHGIKIIYFTELKKYDSFLGEKLVKDENNLLVEIKKYV